MTHVQLITPIFKFKTSMLKSSLYELFVKGTITVANTGAAAAPNNGNKKVILKNYTPFIDLQVLML